jgi:hypothetical protein
VTPDGRRLLAVLDDALPAVAAVEDWVTLELRHMRRAAQSEAAAAYDEWRRHPGAAPYAAYRAAQDRADAAQDHLATWLSPTSAA